MIRCRSTRTSPPGGWKVGNVQTWSFSEACHHVQLNHPEMNAQQIALLVDTENALRCLSIGATNYVTMDSTPDKPIFTSKSPGIPAVKPHIPVTLLAVDTTPKAHLAARAIERCLEQASFAEVKLLTNKASLPHAVVIPELKGLEGYSEFCIRELHKHFSTSHVLLVQWDGYVLNGLAWNPDFLNYDYIGSPWLPSRHVGNGGFSIRSKRLLKAASGIPGQPHPEDNFICNRFSGILTSAGMRFAQYPIASKFAFEGRSWNGEGKEWEGVPLGWAGQFGFHSFLTPLPKESNRPKVFHHSGDMGDVIYSLPAIRALGGGALYISADCRHPYPCPPRVKVGPEWSASLATLTNAQEYIWNTQWTQRTPFSADYDLNEFRKYYSQPSIDPTSSLWALNRNHWGLKYEESESWLKVERPNPVAPIVIARSARYHNDDFPWLQLAIKYGNQSVFVGTKEEYRAFPFQSIPYQPTANLLELARVIAGSKVFIGNQSCPLAIALGLGKNVVTEAWKQNPNCNLHRANQIHWLSGPLDIPKEWL